MTDISQKTFEIIKHTHLEPISRRRLFIKWALLWLLIIFFILIGSSAFSVLIFGLMDIDWNILLSLDQGIHDHLVIDSPLLWILCALMLVLITSLTFRVTKQGYHYQKRWLVFASLFLSAFLGFFLQLAGWGCAIDEVLEKRIPNYASVPEKELDLWQNPEHGLLTGRINAIDGNVATLRDPADNDWIINLRNPVELREIEQYDCKQVKLVGTRTGENVFFVKEIYPWQSKFYPCLSP